MLLLLLLAWMSETIGRVATNRTTMLSSGQPRHNALAMVVVSTSQTHDHLATGIRVQTDGALLHGQHPPRWAVVGLATLFLVVVLFLCRHHLPSSLSCLQSSLFLLLTYAEQFTTFRLKFGT